MPQKRSKLPVILSIAGHDPSSGAGITADIKTIAAHGCYGVTCVTALTVQSTRGVNRVDAIEGRIVTETLEHLMDDLDISAVKIGMLGSAEGAKSVAAFLKRYSLEFVVLDPIVRSSSGAELISAEGLQVMKERIIGRACVITPNIDEAAILTGLTVASTEEMQASALRLHEIGRAQCHHHRRTHGPAQRFDQRQRRADYGPRRQQNSWPLNARNRLRIFHGAGV
jgi:hydroxymethylpyrimidine/phosphomethylpyrimidine kinase